MKRSALRRTSRTSSGSTSKSKPDDPSNATIWFLGRAYYAYVGVLEEVLAECEIDQYVLPGMGHVLVALFEEDQCSIKTIALRAHLSHSALTKLLKRMEQVGLIERTRDERDSRVVRVTLTALGRSIRPRFYKAVGIMNGLFSNGLGAKGAIQLKRLLHRLMETLHVEEKERRATRKQTD